MLSVAYKPRFVRQFDQLEAALQDEVIERIADVRDVENHRRLKVHKLHGALKRFYAFSVNYRYRIIFQYETKGRIVLIGIGDHQVYE